MMVNLENLVFGGLTTAWKGGCVCLHRVVVRTGYPWLVLRRID